MKGLRKSLILAVLAFLTSLLVCSFNTIPAAAQASSPVPCYEVITSPEMSFSDGGWGGWSVPAGKVVIGGGFYATAPVSASAPGTPDSVWPHYTFGSDEYGWVVRDAPDGVGNTITIYAICADEPDGYGVAESSVLNYGDGGWGGWSVPGGEVVLGGGFVLGDPYSNEGGPAAASAPAGPGSAWPHYTFGVNEYGWVVRDALDGKNSPNSRVYAIYADEPACYSIVQSSVLNYGDGGWAGWSVPNGTVALGGGFVLGAGGPAAVSVPGIPDSVWPHYTFGDNEYGWVVRDDPDSTNNPNSRVYAIAACAAPCRATLTIEKVAYGGNGLFNFDGTDPIGQFSLVGGHSQTFSGLLPGTYTITEQVPTNWVLKDINTVGNDFTAQTVENGVTLTVEQGGNVTCVFTDLYNVWGGPPIVGMDIYPVDKIGLLMPWLVAAGGLLLAATVLIVIKRMTREKR